MSFPTRSLPFALVWEQPAPKRSFPLASSTVLANDKSGAGVGSWKGAGTKEVIRASQYFYTDSREVFSWPEMSFYLWNGAASAVIPFVQNISLSYEKSIDKYLFDATATPYAARSQYVETDQNIRVTIGAMFAGASMMQLMKSGVNISAVVSMMNGADQITAEFVLRSARAPSFQLEGNAAQAWRQQIHLVAADITYQGSRATGV